MIVRPTSTALAAVALLVATSGCSSGTTDGSAATTAAPSATAATTSSSFPDDECMQARETFTDARNTRSRTFGGGQDGRDALRAMRDTVERHPECFDADTVEQVPERAEGLLPPTVAAEQALAEAEDACGPPPHSAYSGGPPQTPTANTPERAVTDARDEAGGTTVPQGEPLRTFEGDGLVGFSFRDGDGFNGWVLTVRTDSGWYVRHAVACGGSTATVMTESTAG